MQKVTAKEIENYTQPGTYDVGDGLRLVIKTTGTKSWILRYQFEGVRRDMGLGSYPKASLSEARKRATEKRALINQGIDPVKHKESEKRRQDEARAKAKTFQDCALEYIETHRSGWKNAKHTQQWHNTLETYVFPVIGDKLASEIDEADVLEILKPIWSTKTETASRVRSRVELVLDWARANKLRTGENPARWRGHLDMLLPKTSKVHKPEHHAAMPWRDLPMFWEELSLASGFGAKALGFTILTACRTSEVLEARWSEIDLQNKLWIIPALRMKADREHRVPLCDAAIELLKSLPQENDFVFPGMKQGRPLSNLSMLMVMRRMNKGQFTVHGFRSTFRDWAAESANAPRELCEQVLAHKIANKAEAAYFRSDLLESRRKLMDDWARYTTGYAEPAKIVFATFGRSK